MSTAEAGRSPYAQPALETAAALRTSVQAGLSEAEAAARLAATGRNEAVREAEAPWWGTVREALTEPLVLVLLAVGILYALLGEVADALTIVAVILAVAALETLAEARARRAVDALKALSAPAALVVRDGQAREIPAPGLVPGDLVLLGPGRRVPADLRLVLTEALRVDEASLTGESAPILKQADLVLPPDTALGDRRNLAFAGTLVTAGKGQGVVVGTGRATELGRIATLTEEAREPRTPLQRHMAELSRWLVWVALGFSVLVPLLGVLVAGQPPRDMLLTGLTLAFATIPEELPILITMVLGLGAYRLARERAIVKRLRAAETLGSVSVVGTDKTGTLTENRMRLRQVATGHTARDPLRAAGDPQVRRLLEIGVLASDAQLTWRADALSFVGDPTEAALLAGAAAAGLDVARVRAGAVIEEEYPFDDERRRLSVVYRRDGERWVVTKGAPESVLDISSHRCRDGRAIPLDPTERARILAAAERLAAAGMRTLAFAERRLPEHAGLHTAPAEADLCFVGLAGLEDPPRPEARETIATLGQAGVRVLMLTGDHPATARAIARQVGIAAEPVVLGQRVAAASDAELERLVQESAVFARIAPEHKLRIVRLLRGQGAVVAVTGDGVNDAPALREAAIGVAMGQGGTDVAREAADLVLADDNLATVTVAIQAGRTLYANLRKAVRFYLAAKVALVGASLAAVLLALPVPFVPVQIIVMELSMDLGASLTFVSQPPEGDVMAEPPRDPRTRFMDRSMLLGIAGGGASLAGAVLTAAFWTWQTGRGADAMRTAAFIAWMVGHVVLAAHMRAERQPLLAGRLRDPALLVWMGAAGAVVALGMTVPLLRERLHLTPLPAQVWLVTLLAALVLPSWWEVSTWWRRRRRAAR